MLLEAGGAQFDLVGAKDGNAVPFSDEDEKAFLVLAIHAVRTSPVAQRAQREGYHCA